MKKVRKVIAIIFIVISVVNIGLVILQAIIHPTNTLYGTGRFYNWPFAIPLVIIQIVNIVLLIRILKKYLESDKKTFIKKLIIPIIILIITFFVPIHDESHNQHIDVEATEENAVVVRDGKPYTYDILHTYIVKNIYEITLHKEESKESSGGSGSDQIIDQLIIN